ncbi:MAG: nucleotidyltransferase family protein [bacterium]|nr:MAG: nucleotidyltransferase family protein [bacterium]
MSESILDLNREERLLVLVAGSAVSENGAASGLRREVEKLLGNGFDWHYYKVLAGYHQYLAATYRFLRGVGVWEILPEGERAALEGEYLLAQARFIKKEAELLEVLGALDACGIEPIVFKGIPQAVLMYGDPGIRVSKDIDILVDPSRVEEARKVLMENGYTIYSGLRSIQDYRDYHFHFIFTRGERMDSVVELHWSLLDPKKHLGMDREALERKAISVPVGGRNVKTLAVPHTMWYLCIHLSYKLFFDLRNLAELSRLTSTIDEAQWNELITWADDSNTTRELAIALHLCEFIFGRVIPEGLRRRLRPGVILKRLALSTYYPRGLVWEWVPYKDTHELVMTFFLRQGAGEKLKFLFHLAFPDRRTIQEVYFRQMKKLGYRRFGYFWNGLYVQGKVIMMALLLGFLIQRKILSEQVLDPARQERVRKHLEEKATLPGE